MKCAGCGRSLEVGDRYIEFTMSEWAERKGDTALEGMDDLFAEIMGSGKGDMIVYCENCTEKSSDGWRDQMVYGDEEEVEDEAPTDEIDWEGWLDK